MIDVAPVELGRNSHGINAREGLAVAACQSAALGPAAEAWQTGAEYRCLHFIEPRVDPELLVPVFVGLSAVAEALGARREGPSVVVSAPPSPSAARFFVG